MCNSTRIYYYICITSTVTFGYIILYYNVSYVVLYAVYKSLTFTCAVTIVGNTSMRTIRTIRGANEWALILEHSHKGDYERIRLIQVFSCIVI